MLTWIKIRPVRFALLCEAVLVMLLAFGVSLTVEQMGAVLGVVNAFLALWLDNFTTSVDSNGEPRSSDYIRSPQVSND